jgi:pimeloyl-ACP methyl ester carboxylesterase
MITLILLPGLGGTGELFEPFLAALGSAVAVKVIRYPGDVALGYDALGRFVRAMLPEGEPFVLLGESFSGPIAISLAATGGTQLRGLILCCSFARNPRPSLGPLSTSRASSFRQKKARHLMNHWSKPSAASSPATKKSVPFGQSTAVENPPYDRRAHRRLTPLVFSHGRAKN